MKSISPRLLPVALLFAALPLDAQRVMTTFAGRDWFFDYQGKRALDTPLSNFVRRIVTDRAGNLYLADPDNHQVFKIDTAGVTTVAAGNGIPGFSGDGGPARDASLEVPYSLAIDRAGNLYIFDGYNHRVRRVTREGVITTFAGSGELTYSGDGGPALRAGLGWFEDMVFDSAGNLYCADVDANRVRVIRTDGTIQLFAGTGDSGRAGNGGPARQAQFNGVQGLAIDPEGRVYVSEYYNSWIRRIDTNGTITVFAGTGDAGDAGDGGPALQAQFNRPYGMLFDAQGGLLVSDLDNHSVRRVAPSGTVTRFAGSGQFAFSGDGGTALAAAFRYPTGIALVPGGDVLVMDSGNARVRRITPGQTIRTVAGNGLFRSSPDGIPARDLFLFEPTGIAIAPNGDIYIADTNNNVIRRVRADGRAERIAGVNVRAFGPDPNADARQSALALPSGLAFAPNGDLIIADTDNDRIRRVDASGAIRTIAGTGIRLYGGDGGPAIAADLNQPTSAAYDSQGNLYIADAGNLRVRRVDPNGVIRTFAGNGEEGASGDGGPAAAAAIGYPLAVVVDRANNVYIAGYGTCRVRRVAPDGIIRNFAGTGVCGASAGDGGPALAARLGEVQGLSLDAAGALYISDDTNNQIRRVGPDGVISTAAGSGLAGYGGDGGPPELAEIGSAFQTAVSANGTLYITDRYNHRIRAVISAATRFAVAPTALTFTIASGSGLAPAQTVSLTGTVDGIALPGIPFSASASQPWIRLSADSGVLPATSAIAVDPGSLAAGNYSGTVRFSVPGASPPAIDVAVSLTVSAAQPPRLSGSSSALAFAVTQGSAPAQRPYSLTNTGSGVLAVRIAASAATGGNWLSVSPDTGSATSNTPLTLTVTANPAGLAPGTYAGSLAVTSNGGDLTVPVTLTVAAPQTAVLVLSQTGLAYRAAANGGRPLAQPVAILNTGAGALDWTARAVTLSGGSNWLRLSSPTGSAPRPYLDISTLEISADPAGLAAGEYYGRVEIASPSAQNSPQTVAIVLTVVPPGSNPGPDVQPTALVFVGPERAGSQAILIGNPMPSPVSFGSSRTFLDNATNAFTHAPASGTVPPGDPVRLVVQPGFAGLPAGITRSFLSLGFSDGSSRTVNILTVIPPAASGDARYAAACRANGLRVEITSLQRPAFQAIVGQPARVEAKIVDDCGNPLLPGDGQPLVQAGFSNRDRRVDLVHTGNGVWSGTWTPVNGPLGPVTVDVTALLGLAARTQLGQGSLGGQLLPAPQTAPVLAPGGVLNAASFQGGVVSPGSYVSIFGLKLASEAGGAQSVPLPTSIAGTRVSLGGRDLPLNYVSDGQVNALVPYDLTSNTQHQLLVQRGSSLTVPETVVVAPAQPAIYTQNQSGSGPGVIVNGVTNALLTPQNPARAGDVLVIYANGLGAVDPPVALGAAAPLSGPLSRTTNPVRVRIGGVAATPQFAGLAPGFPGLYQINVAVPAGVAPGDAVEVVLEVAGQFSKPVTVPVR